jgi:CRP/FNR family cyclic AMP-dependent transcriptional regulator
MSLAAHPFLRRMPRDRLGLLTVAACDVRFRARYRIFEDGGNATRFWLVQSGHVSLDLQVPGEGPVVIETIGMGELLGWSCQFPPYSWAFGAVAATPVEAFEFDAPAVREACAADAGLGYELNQRITGQRLQATRIRLYPAPATRRQCTDGKSTRSGPRRKSLAAAANGSACRAGDGVRLRTGIRDTTRRRLLSISSEETL